MLNDGWIKTSELMALSQKKDILFWGAGTGCKRTIECAGLQPAKIIDSNPNFHDVIMEGARVVPYSKALATDDSVVIITTGSYPSLIQQVCHLHPELKLGVNLFISPIFEPMKVRDSLLAFDKNILYTVPLTVEEGGGLYLFNTLNRRNQKLYAGECRALIKVDSGYMMCDGLRGLVIFDHEFKVEKTVELPAGSRPHGLAFSEPNQMAYVVCSGRDSICFIDVKQSVCVDEVFISNKCRINGMNEQHHLNDVCLSDDGTSLFVSMFSFSGKWRLDVFDGGVIIFNLNSKQFESPIISQLWMPHTVKIVRGVLSVADSMRGTLHSGSNNLLGDFPGFIRGFDFSDGFYCIGQSSHRYLDKLQGHSRSIQLNAGIYIFDPDSCANVFHPIDKGDNIYTVLVSDRSFEL